MKRVSSQHIADVLRECVEAEGLDDGLKRSAAVETWGAMVGDAINSQCGRPFFRGEVLMVRVPSAGLRNELMMRRSQLIAAINRFVGKEVVREIRYIS